MPAELIDYGAQVRNARPDGRPLVVKKIGRHEAQDLVEIITSSASLVVSAGHRVMVEVEGMAQPAPAEELCEGWRVILVGGTSETVLAVLKRTEQTQVIEFTFEPDEPVAAFHEPSSQILTMGRRSQGRTRRGGRTGTTSRLQARNRAQDRAAAETAQFSE